MTGEPLPPEGAPPPENVPGQAENPAPPTPERQPFWGYSDLFLLAGAAIPCMLLGWAVVKGLFLALRFRPAMALVELLPQQFLGYGFLFAALALVLRLQYNRPFWRSLGWTRFRIPFLWLVICGFFCSIAVALLGAAIGTPTKANPMTEMMDSPTSVALMAVFGITLAPLAEELFFRGFLQPLLVRSLGAVAGILAASVPFGFLHYHEYGNSWRHAVLIGLAGASFGWMRHATGSTRASTIMHAAYNGFIFLVVIMQGRRLPHG